MSTKQMALEALREVSDARYSYERYGSVSILESEPLIRASTLVEIADTADVAIAALEADLAQPVEPVVYQYRITPTDKWRECSAPQADCYERHTVEGDWKYEVRRLYTAPQAATINTELLAALLAMFQAANPTIHGNENSPIEKARAAIARATRI